MVKQNAKRNASMIASCGSEDFGLEHECQSEVEAVTLSIRACALTWAS